MRLEIADGRAREEADLGQARDCVGELERGGEVRCDRMDGERGKVATQNIRLAFNELAGNIDRHVSCHSAAIEQEPHLGG